MDFVSLVISLLLSSFHVLDTSVCELAKDAGKVLKKKNSIGLIAILEKSDL